MKHTQQQVAYATPDGTTKRVDTGLLALLAVVTALALALSGCSTTSKHKDDPTKDWSAAMLYERAKEALDRNNYQRAIEQYETLEARFPFGHYAQQAQLESAYAYYKFQEPDSAIASAERFIKLHPKHEHVDYAYYLKGLANFNRGRTFLNRFIPRNRATRDPEPMQRAFDDFAQLVRNYPESRYAADARQRMIYLRNELAEYELNVAKYYVTREAYVAVLNRAQYCLDQYQGAEAVPKALAMMVTAYDKLGLEDLARDTRRILALNFPSQASELIASTQ